MHVSSRSYITAGVAMLGAGAIALAPVQAPLAPAVTPGHISFQAVELAATVNPITNLLALWNNTETNVAGLANAFLAAPFPTAQQVVANWLGYLTELPDVQSILTQICDNFHAAIEAPFAVDTGTLDETHAGIWALLPQFVTIPPNLQPILDFTTTYTSGVLIGLIGPVLAPVLSLGQSLNAIWKDIIDENDWAAAINRLVNIPVDMVNAFLNGGVVMNLTPFLSSLLPAQLTKVGIMLGGLLSPGGSIFNSLDLNVHLGPGFDIPVPGVPAGALGSLIGLGGAIAKAIGWSGTGNPLHPGIPVPGAAAVSAASVAASDDEADDAPAASDDSATDDSGGDDSGIVTAQAPAPDKSAGRGRGSGRGSHKSAASGGDSQGGGSSAGAGGKHHGSHSARAAAARAS